MTSERRRGRLSRDRLAAAGLELIDERGLAALSMRALGARLAVEAMTLYRYTPSKADLLDAVVELLLTQMRTAAGRQRRGPGSDWQSRLNDVAHAVRGTATAHPGAFGLLASYSPPRTWLRPPLCDPIWVAMILRDLRAAGFDDDSAMGAYRDLAGFLLGHLLPEATRDAATATSGATTNGTESPALVLMAHQNQTWALRAHPAGHFQESLDRLIDRLPLSAR